MNILVLTNLFPNPKDPSHGIFIKHRVKQYLNFGHQVTVLVPQAYTPFIQRQKDSTWKGLLKQTKLEGIPVVYFRYFHLPFIGMYFQPLSILIVAFFIIYSLRKKGFTFHIIDGHYLYPDGVTASILGSIFKRPVFLSARGSDINVLTKYWLPRVLIYRSLIMSRHIISVSNSLKSVLLENGIPTQKISVVRNGIDASLFYFSPEIYKKSLDNKGKIIKRILMVGHLLPSKGQDLLIDTLKNYQNTSLPFSIHAFFIGSGQLANFISSEQKNISGAARIRLIGPVPQSRLTIWYNRVDLLCLLSSREGCPNVVLEALACGLPVLATPVGDLINIIKEGVNGFILQDTDYKTLWDELCRALNHRWDRALISEKARNFTWNDVGKKLDDIFKKRSHTG